MTRQYSSTLSSSSLRSATALALALVLAMAATVWAPPARAAAVAITDAEFRWGLNKQSSGPSHGPGLNFLSAGDIAGAITGPNTAIAPADWKASSGDVTIEKRTASGSSAPATWAGVQTDQSGTTLSSSTSKYSGLEMVFTGGEGTVDPEAKTAAIEWDGTVSVLYYSGFVYLTISDPVLTVTPSRAVVTATLGGHRTDRENSSVWTPMTPKSVTLANLDRRDLDLGDETGISAEPEYRGVSYPRADSEMPQVKTGPNWGAFPESFLDFAKDSGSGGFWYSTGASFDATKLPLPIIVSWDSDNPHSVPDSNGGGSGNSGNSGIVGEVIGDAVEDIIRAAGTDVSDTAAAWMDEAWKPLQPDAVKAAQAAQAAAPAPDAGDSSTVVVDEFAEEYEEYYAAGAPMTAGTVGATLATITAPSGGGSSAPAPAAPASNFAAPQAAAPVASNLPLSEVAYAQTSASSETGNPTHQWQWWVGAALLALAAGLFYQTVRRKD